MPTREEMLAFINSKKSTPSREEMIRHIQASKAATKPTSRGAELNDLVPDSNTPEALVSGFNDGATFGHGAEVAAATADPLNYEQTRSAIEAKNRNMDNTNVFARATGKALGGVASGVMMPFQKIAQAYNSTPELLAAVPGFKQKLAAAAGKYAGLAGDGAVQGLLQNSDDMGGDVEHQLRVKLDNGYGGAKFAMGVGATGSVLKAAADKVSLPAIGEFFTGVPKNASKNYVKHMDFVDQLSQNGEAIPYVEGVQKDIQDTMQKTKTNLGKAVAESIDNAKYPVDISKAKLAYQDRIKFLQSKPNLTNADQAEIEALRNDYNKYFEIPVKETASVNTQAAAKPVYNKTEEEYAQDLQKAISQFRARQMRNPGEYELQQIAEDLKPKQIGEQKFSTSTRGVDDGSTYDFRTGKTTKPITELPNEVSGSSAFDLQKNLKQAAAYETGMTPANASAKGSARNAYSAINQGLDAATDGLSSDTKANYARFNQIGDEINNNFGDLKKTYSTLTNLDSPSNKMLSERLKQLVNTGELDVTDAAEKLQAYRHFGDPGDSALSSGGTTSTSRTKAGMALNSGVGALIGSNFGPYGSSAGATLGALSAPVMYSPSNLKSMLKFNAALDNRGIGMPSLDQLNQTLPPSVYKSFYDEKNK